MSKLNSLQDVINNFNQRMADLKQQMTKEFEKEIRGIFTEIFTANPTIKKIGWMQYTPFFNDGEPCVFSVHGIYFCCEHDDDTDNDSIYDWRYMSGNIEKEGFVGLKELENLMDASDDILLTMFGDHVRVIVTPDGLDVEEYEDHD